MPFCTIGAAKLKGGSLGSSEHHVDRTRETPNADPERTHLNRVIVVGDGNVRELVSEVINEHGGKPRRHSVEAIELLLSASPEYFDDENPQKREEKLENFVTRVRAFLADRRNCGVCIKAVLHLDERTPHVHAHLVSIDPEGRLNASHYLDGQVKLRALHDRYAEAMRPLGLGRGREGSRASHQTVKQFYASVEREVDFWLDHSRVPDPPRVMLTAEAVANYKEKVLTSVLDQLREPIQTLSHQAMLTKDERAHRVEAERRAGERVAAVEAAAREAVTAVEERAAARFATLERSARALLDESRELYADKDHLRIQRNELNEELGKERYRAGELHAQVRGLGERLTDIPMPEVIDRLGYGPGERQGEALVYRGEQGQVAMSVREQRAHDGNRELICRNSLDLVHHMVSVNEGQAEFTKADALDWLREEFGDRRATGAFLTHSEQGAYGRFDRARERERKQGLPDRSQGRDAVQQINSHDRGDGEPGFSR